MPSAISLPLQAQLASQELWQTVAAVTSSCQPDTKACCCLSLSTDICSTAHRRSLLSPGDLWSQMLVTNGCEQVSHEKLLDKHHLALQCSRHASPGNHFAAGVG